MIAVERWQFDRAFILSQDEAMNPLDWDGSSFDRALYLLHAILADAGVSRIGEIAGRVDIPLSSAHRLVGQLERRGFIVRTGRGRYVAGLALLPVLSQASLDSALAATGRPYLKRLAHETGSTAHLGILRADMVTYLVKEGANQIFTRESMQLEAYCSGIGKMLLSSLPDGTLVKYLDQDDFVALTPSTIIDPDLLRVHLRVVRDQDFALDDREISENLRCLAVPIRGPDGIAVAAISAATDCQGPFPSPDLLTKLRAVAAGIEGHMRR